MGRNRASGGRAAAAGVYPEPYLVRQDMLAFEEKYEQWTGGLTEDEFSALRGYTDTDYKLINAALRGGEVPAAIEPNVARIDRALARARIPHNITAVRYIDSNYIGGLSDGAVFTDKGFVSTSVNGVFTWGGHRTVVRIPKGYHAASVENLTNVPGEHELLLRRNTSFRVVHRGKGTFSDPTILQVVP